MIAIFLSFLAPLQFPNREMEYRSISLRLDIKIMLWEMYSGNLKNAKNVGEGQETLGERYKRQRRKRIVLRSILISRMLGLTIIDNYMSSMRHTNVYECCPNEALSAGCWEGLEGTAERFVNAVGEGGRGWMRHRPSTPNNFLGD